MLRDLQLLPYALYNQGLERFSEGDYYGALLKVSSAVELSSEFEEAHLLLAKIVSALGLKIDLKHQSTNSISSNRSDAGIKNPD